MGNTIEDMKNITSKRILRTYRKYKTARKTAIILGISHPTVTKYLRKEGITINEPGWSVWNILGKGKERFKRSVFAVWLREHPYTVLSRDIHEIAKVTGIKDYTIRAYLRRRYKSALYSLKKIEPFTNKNVTLTALDSKGLEYKWSLKLLTSYTYKIDKFEYTITIVGKVIAKEGSFIVKYLPIGISEFIDKYI